MGAEPDSAGLEQAQRRDQAAEGVDGGHPRLRLALVVVGRVDAHDGEKRRLPGRDPEPLARPRLGGNVDRVGADDRGACQIEPRHGHLKAAQGHDHLDLPDLGLACELDLVDRGGEAVVVEREVRAAHPEATEEGEAGELCGLARLGGDADAHPLQVRGGEPGGLERGARGAEGVEAAQLAGVVADEELRQRLVSNQRRAVAGLAHLIRDLLAVGGQPVKALGSVAGHRDEGLAYDKVAHG